MFVVYIYIYILILIAMLFYDAVLYYRGNILNCTLWEDFAVQFQDYNNQRTEWGHTIILIHNAKIKEATGFFPL
jgi:hypothetical protein